MTATAPSPLPLFPLSAHVLPGGRLPLRLFEPRYLRMVREACRNGEGFGICMLNPREGRALRNMFAIGTKVKVIDFEQLADGLLGVTVEGHSCFVIERLWQETDGLRLGAVRYLPPWPALPLCPVARELGEQLGQLYRQHPHLARLYPEPQPDNASWICQRWLELLPLAAADKQYLLAQPDCRTTLLFLERALSRQPLEPMSLQ